MWKVSKHKMRAEDLHTRRKNPRSGNQAYPAVHFKALLDGLDV